MSLLDPTPLKTFVDKLASRSTLSLEERQAILDLPFYPAQVQTNRDFVRLGERATHSCLVVDGLVGRFGQNRDGARQIVAVHIAGDMVDLHSVVVPRVGSALQALSTTTIIKVPHAALRNLAHEHPAIAEAFWRECVVDAAILAEWIVNIGRRDGQSRMAHLLCEMACRYLGAGSGLDGKEFRFEATQAHIADMLGLTSIHVNRTLKALKALNLISIKGRDVRILDWAELERVGDFDPDYLNQSGGEGDRLRDEAA